MTDAQVGERVRLARAVRRISQGELGKVLGLGHNMVSRIERGTRALTISEAFKIAQALDLSIEWFTSADPPVGGRRS